MKSLFPQNEECKTEKITCLGQTFENDKARRAYFTEELRKMLPELRQIEGFPLGEDEDILVLSDPPYYTACPNPFLGAFVEEWKSGVADCTDYQKAPFVADVSEGKYHPLYRLHPYLTKVPHRAIMRFILHYTNPGDIVFDGFCGTGMTAVAAQLCGDKREVEELGYKVSEDGTILQSVEEGGETLWRPFSRLGIRKTLLNDLSPLASFISYNYFKSTPAIEHKLRKVEKATEWMYFTAHPPAVPEDYISEIVQLIKSGASEQYVSNKLSEEGKNFRMGRINYVVWSDVFTCPECSNDIVFWHSSVDKKGGKVLDSFACSVCGAELKKRVLERKWSTTFDTLLNSHERMAVQVPVLINYSVRGQRFEKEVDDLDLALLDYIEQLRPVAWAPTDALPDGINTNQPKESHGVSHVHHFYSKRNLITLSKVLEEGGINDSGFIITRVAGQITKLYRFTYQNGVWGAGGGPLSGTLYIPSLVKELSIMKQLKAALKNQQKKTSDLALENVCISVNSTTEEMSMGDESVDYIFLDPPFGSNKMYSEINSLSESWLKVCTNNSEEAIVNAVQGKDISAYRNLMLRCFEQAYRVLKPNRWMTVEFSNSQASVWNSIQDAIQQAGFVIANVAALDKKKSTFKAVTTATAVKQDLIISAYKPSEVMISNIRTKENTEDSAWIFVRNHLEKLPVFVGTKGEAELIVERTPRVLFDRMVAYHVQNGYSVPISSAEFQEGVAQRFPMRDGMTFLETQVTEYDKKRLLAKEFVQTTLFVSDENSAIEWLRQQLMQKPQTRQDLHPNFMKELQHISKHELLPELDVLLEQNFLMYDGTGLVPSQIHGYLSTDFKDLRNLEKDDPKLQAKAKNRWYVPDPNKQADLEKLRERSLLREFNSYIEELGKSKKKLRQFRTEAIRAGFKTAWGNQDYQTIVDVGQRLPEKVLQEDSTMLMYYDNAQVRLGM